jgi:hypothetical protein
MVEVMATWAPSSSALTLLLAVVLSLTTSLRLPLGHRRPLRHHHRRFHKLAKPHARREPPSTPTPSSSYGTPAHNSSASPAPLILGVRESERAARRAGIYLADDRRSPDLVLGCRLVEIR